MPLSSIKTAFFYLGLWICVPWQAERTWTTLSGLRGELRLEKTIILQEKLAAKLIWQMNGPQRTLEFPWSAAQDSLDLRYTPDKSAPARFSLTLPGHPDPSSIEVRSSRSRLEEGKDWHITGSSLNFRNSQLLGPEGSLYLSYQTLPYPRLRFPLAANEGSPPYRLEAEIQLPGRTWSKIKVDWDKGELIFKNEDYQPGARLRVHYQEAYLEAGTLRIPENIALDSLSIDSLPQGCTLADVVLEKNTLLSTCSAGSHEKMIFAYEHTLTRTRFDSEDLLPEAAAEKARWRLHINGREELAYQRSGTQFLLYPSPYLPEEARLEAEIKL